MSISKIASSPRPAVGAPRNDSCNDEAVTRLLDVVASIIADEYIRVARQHKETFKDCFGPYGPSQ